MTAEKTDNLTEFVRKFLDADAVRGECLAKLVDALIAEINKTIRSTVQGELSERSDAKAGLLIKREIAERLQISVSTVSKLQTQGLPSIPFGKSVRFEYSEVVAWAKDSRTRVRGKSKLRMVA